MEKSLSQKSTIQPYFLPIRTHRHAKQTRIAIFLNLRPHEWSVST